MIKITNGKITVEVTKGAYDSFFAKQGFEVLNDNEEWEENENGEEEHDFLGGHLLGHLERGGVEHYRLSGGPDPGGLKSV